MRLENQIGKTYHRLTILEEVERHVYPSGDTRRKFLAQCSCGSEPKTYLISELRSGNTKSCGCWNIEKIKSHGMHNTRAYQCWADMKTRCDNPKNKCYRDYGGRGITYCNKWKTFEGFWEDMQENYSDDLTLNRRDNDGNYCKENCSWDNKNFQGHMKRKQEGTNLNSIGMIQNLDTLMFHARIKLNRKSVALGSYATEEKAAKAYDDASEVIYGDRPNKTQKVEDEIFRNVQWYLANREEDLRRIKSPSAKLTEAEVLEVIKLYSEGVLQKDIARKFNVLQCTISSICRGDSWSRVTGIVKKVKQ
jgi:hypothetical protein